MSLLLSAGQVILLLLLVLVIFNLMIVVHEIGHFLAARWRGMVVDRFGIWFGRPLWQRKIGGVTYSLGTIPAGGFVSLPQMAPMESIEGKLDLTDEQLQQIRNKPATPLDKIIVAFAGPLFSLLLALAFACLVWAVGKPVDESEITTTIGYVKPGDPADQAGIRPGDKILSVDGKPVNRFLGMLDNSIFWNIVSSEGDTIHFLVQRDGATLELNATPKIAETAFYQRGALRGVGIAPEEKKIFIGSFASFRNSPAQAAGLREGDQVIKVDGQPALHPSWISDRVREAGKARRPIAFTLLRDGKELTIPVTPLVPVQLPDTATDEQKTSPMIGVTFQSPKWTGLDHPNPLTQIADSVKTIGATLKAVTSGKSGIGAQHLSGPIGILNNYYILLTIDQGWRLVLWFSVLLNVNLAVMNLLPLPVLDGGHITMSLIEIIFRRPLPIRVLETVQTACVFVLLGFMVFVTFFDVQDIGRTGIGAPTGKSPTTQQIVFPDQQPAPPAP